MYEGVQEALTAILGSVVFMGIVYAMVFWLQARCDGRPAVPREVTDYIEQSRKRPRG